MNAVTLPSTPAQTVNKSRARLHAIVAAAVVIGAEFEGLKNETYQQLAAHTIVFWLCLGCAIIVGIGNSIISTKPQPGEASSDSPALSIPPGPGPAGP